MTGIIEYSVSVAWHSHTSLKQQEVKLMSQSLIACSFQNRYFRAITIPSSLYDQTSLHYLKWLASFFMDSGETLDRIHMLVQESSVFSFNIYILYIQVIIQSIFILYESLLCLCSRQQPVVSWLLVNVDFSSLNIMFSRLLMIIVDIIASGILLWGLRWALSLESRKLNFHILGCQWFSANIWMWAWLLTFTSWTGCMIEEGNRTPSIPVT